MKDVTRFGPDRNYEAKLEAYLLRNKERAQKIIRDVEKHRVSGFFTWGDIKFCVPDLWPFIRDTADKSINDETSS